MEVSDVAKGLGPLGLELGVGVGRCQKGGKASQEELGELRVSSVDVNE